MAEETLRRNLDRAFDPGHDFPHPMLLSRTIALLDTEVTAPRRAWITRQPAWLLPAVAALLVIAIISGLVLAGRLRATHDNTPMQHGPAAAACSEGESGPFPATIGGGPVEPLPPAPVKMANASTAWAGGGLRTTDGGIHWRDVSPAALREGISPTSYPPEFADFYLDGDHAWEVRAYNTATVCTDHLATFKTRDGGKTWQESTPVSVHAPSNWIVGGLGDPQFDHHPTTQLDFIDAENGWLWVPIGPLPLSGTKEVASITDGDLFGTSDGGLHWRHLSHLSATSVGLSSSATCTSFLTRFVFGTIHFATPKVGWISVPCSAAPEILASRDGGATWRLEQLPAPASVPPVFFDTTHGILQGAPTGINPCLRDDSRCGTSTGPSLFSTSDQGATWQALPALPRHSTSEISTLYFASPRDFWYVVANGNCGKCGGPTPARGVYHSADRGQSWIQLSGRLPIAQANAVVFADPQHGLMLGLAEILSEEGGALTTESYILLATSDGGRTWRTITPQVQRAG